MDCAAGSSWLEFLKHIGDCIPRSVTRALFNYALLFVYLAHYSISGSFVGQLAVAVLPELLTARSSAADRVPM